MPRTIADVRDPNAVHLHAIWQTLPDGSLTRTELHSAILRAKGITFEDDALASGIRSSLVLCGAIEPRRASDGSIAYFRAARFPILKPCGIGTDRYNAELRRLADEEHARADEATRLRRENDPQHRSFQELLSIVDARVAEHVSARTEALIDERFDDLTEELEHTVDRGTVDKIRALLKRRKETAATSGTE